MRSSPIQYRSSPTTWPKYFGREWMKGITTARPPYTFGSWVAIGPVLVELPSLRRAVPLGGVELDALQSPLAHESLEDAQALLAVARVEGAVGDQLVRVLAHQRAVVLGGVEALDVEVLQVRGLEDRLVHVSDFEEVMDEVLLGVLLVFVERPHVLRGTEVAVVVVEAVDEARAVLVGLVLRAGVPEVHMPVYNEVLAALALVHVVPPIVCQGAGD